MYRKLGAQKNIKKGSREINQERKVIENIGILHIWKWGPAPPPDKRVTAMIRRCGWRRRRIVQHSKNLMAQLSPSLCAAMLCHIKARRSSRWDGVVSRDRGVMREGEEVVQGREEGKKMADRRSRWTRGRSEEKVTWTYEMSQKRRVPAGFPCLQKRGGKGAQRGNRRCNVESFLPLLSPPPQSDAICWNNTDDVTSQDTVSCRSRSSFPRWFSCTVEGISQRRSCRNKARVLEEELTRQGELQPKITVVRRAEF